MENGDLTNFWTILCDGWKCFKILQWTRKWREKLKCRHTPKSLVLILELDLLPWLEMNGLKFGMVVEATHL